MQDRPTYGELLEAIQQFLEQDVIAALEGTKKFHARVAANLLGIIRRELDSEDEQLRREWRGLDELLGAQPLPSDRRERRGALQRRTQELCERIRAGDADCGPWREQVSRHVRQTVLDKLMVANPRHVGAQPQTSEG